MSRTSRSLSYRAGEVIELLETLALATRNLEEAGSAYRPRAIDNLAGSLELLAEIASGVFDDMERAIGPSAMDQPPARRKA